jgi:sialate O-acetylesterase
LIYLFPHEIAHLTNIKQSQFFASFIVIFNTSACQFKNVTYIYPGKSFCISMHSIDNYFNYKFDIMKQMKFGLFFTVLFSLLVFATSQLNCQVHMPLIFSDNMVLQRDQEIRVWGRAGSGERVRVTLGKQRQTARAANDGRWEVLFAPLNAGGPYTMKVEGRNTLEYSNILIGDVWLCSGQSNMEWPVSQSANPDQEIRNSSYPEIRLFTVPRRTSSKPEDDLESGTWEECGPETVASFSATGYFFGRHIHGETGVPVGLINSSWGGTVAETWISRETMAGIDDFKEIMARAGEPDLEKQQEEIMVRLMEWNETIEQHDEGKAGNWHDPGHDDSKWDKMKLPTQWESAGLPGVDGVVWFRKEITLSAEEAQLPLTLNLGAIDDSDYTYLNGQLVGTTLNQYSQNRRYMVDGSMLREGKNIIAVRVIDNGGGGGIWGDAGKLFYQTGLNQVSLADYWKYAVGIETGPQPQLQGGPNSFPSLLYNGMIHPVTPFAIRGVIWYQGESNAGRAYQYRTLFRELIKDWRKQWANNDLPFLFVQLTSFMAETSEPVESDWAELREAQTMALELPNTGMAVIIDIGDADDIHPQNKQDVGKRLALAALKTSYNHDIVSTGPVYRSMQVDGNRIVLSFDTSGSKLKANDKYGYLKGFAIASEDRVFHWAKAYIEDGKVIVYCDKVSHPVLSGMHGQITPPMQIFSTPRVCLLHLSEPTAGPASPWD